jgi:glycosyltransferase involved in cell wall biosynthesis
LLYLVINGTDADKAQIKNYIDNTAKKDKIKMFSKLPESELNSYYKNSIALLIPLRNSYQDIARFPHKIGEYFASGNPIISTNYGEVKFYFQDRKDLLLAEEYDVDQYAEKMQFVVEHPEEAKQIGIDGKNKAAPLFDYRIKAAEINHFLDTAF